MTSSVNTGRSPGLRRYLAPSSAAAAPPPVASAPAYGAHFPAMSTNRECHQVLRSDVQGSSCHVMTWNVETKVVMVGRIGLAMSCDDM